jgi:phosphoglycolate phosphatase-like HAD superfamily hydrolase
MPVSKPTVLAVDFDGVICDGQREYFQTAWKAYCQIWKPEDLAPSETLAAQFYRLRPVVESGWEMPVLLRALILEIPEEQIFQDWTAIATQIVGEDTLAPLEVSAIVDGLRDQWIASDLDSWLAEHRFYSGVAERLQDFQNDAIQVFIISTKEGRFIKQLLQKQGIEFSDDRIYGKESKRPKYQILQELEDTFGETAGIWFIEDRLKTLQVVKRQDNLKQIGLFLADWGYNTAADRHEADYDDRIHLISLAQFSQDFSTWL